jgi:hypothetical protein
MLTALSGRMRIPSLLSLLFILLQAAAPPELGIRAPRVSSEVMIDGVLAEAEWQNSDRVEVPGIAELYFQRSSDLLYVAVKYTKTPSGIVDLYLSSRDGEIYDLHASAKLGERQLQANTFSAWSWWNNHDWTANVSRVDSFEKRTFLRAPIREYQIHLARFPSSAWRLRFELTATGAKNQTLSRAVFPSGTTDKSTIGWLRLDVN